MIKVLVVDNHPIVTTGFKLLFENHEDIRVVGTVSSGVDIFEFVRRNEVDVIISEIELPELNGITALRAIKKEHSHINIIMFSYHPEEIYAISTIKAGASGYVSKSEPIDVIIKAINRASKGEIHLSDKMSKHLNYNDTKRSKSRIYKRLSTREVEVLKLLSSGKKNKEIAQELDINEKTVSTYKARLFKKLNVTNLIDLVNQGKQLDIA
ncbi:response regulator transcription factor [Psychroserpens sp.]|uniref:response regulator transcription factor n=1 Tax=Psychroserpens sp. TaxID=2020870 RepID=UPI001B0B813D|nr:response regulator transcription factor [Psychroserpens sp.]MBO6607960.1 response regulator transcription factor [Psychroserpens sp.]MBO6631116.1 response regulator transcription factor [Psychroserpens sp.]MBO6654913.1 response regulator transcription factor [Psychroserpens sp.]MBO6683013.1 response regulator transcription factor [Psychroserpens sp.]MBO6751318.1 response regulator transcription factor [Psychroserpens sp.]